MKKIIPFKKEMLFNNNVSEITSISLEHDLKVSDAHLINGSFYINGEYKISDNSVNTEVFDFTLPCDINLDNKYNLDNIKIDIDDFYYEVVDAAILKINIDVLIDRLEVKEELTRDTVIETEVDNIEADLIKETPIEELQNDLEGDEKMEILEERCIEEEDISNVKSIFGNFKDNIETYKTYKVYIVREGDTLDSIMKNYNASKEVLDKYNNLNEISLGDKIIIPSLLNEKD